ncbi:MAG TPA: hypothetical protein VEZ90_03450 [Blastocatellia bacterium]|nr:hypothetical protein [Blastocatellia bacterium]
MYRVLAAILVFAAIALCSLFVSLRVRASRLANVLATQQLLPSQARLREEIKKYEQLAAVNPPDVEFRHILAGLYREAELWDKAIEAETAAIERHPKYAVAFWGMGKSRMGRAAAPQNSASSDDYNRAIEDFTSSIRLFELRGGLEIYLTKEQPSVEYIDCYRTRGVALAHLNKYSEGIADVSIAIKLHKEDPKLLYERGYLEEKAGLKKEAVPDYHRAGLIFADGHAVDSARECSAHLDGLGARAEADAIRLLLAPKTPKTDLPK